jgi:hypothetical protein
MNFATSLVESLFYADAFNREFDTPEKVMIGGLPVEYIAPSLKSSQQSLEITGGYNEDYNEGYNESNNESNNAVKKNENGPFANKVVPVGLALIQTGKYPDVEYEDHFHPGAYRNVIPDSLYDTLIGAVMPSKYVSTHKSKSRRVSKKIHK